MNLGAAMARGEYLAVIVDGARMASSRLVAHTLMGAKLCTDPAVFSLSWHLGPDVQNKSMLEGYNQAVEDELLDSIDWPHDSNRLFEISTLAQSSGGGFLGGVPSEFSWICTRRDTFLALGGFDEAFQSPGGGQVNHDFRNRLMTRPGITPVMLLGDGVFHQFHGGVATNVPMAQHPAESFREEYKRLRGEYYRPAPTRRSSTWGPCRRLPAGLFSAAETRIAREHALPFEPLIPNIEMLARDLRLPVNYRDHALTGEWSDHRDCHIKPDLVIGLPETGPVYASACSAWLSLEAWYRLNRPATTTDQRLLANDFP